MNHTNIYLNYYSMSSEKTYSVCVYCVAQICCLISFAFFIISVSIVPDYLATHTDVSINITYYNQTSKYYEFKFEGSFQCIYDIRTSNYCDKNCPLLYESNIYKYYCDCDTKLCGFIQTYSFFNSYQFIMMMVGLSVMFVSGAIIICVGWYC